MQENIKKLVVEHALEDAPREACGLLVKTDAGVQYVRCRNLIEGNETFMLDPKDYVKAAKIGAVIAVVHSHPYGSPEPSQADRVACEASGLPWYIVTVPDEQWGYIAPCGYEADLIGRVWVHGVLDCYSLIRDWYRLECGIILDDHHRQPEWWYKGDNLYIENYKKWGFVRVDDESPQRGDVLLMQVLSNVPNHGAIYLENDIILHHLYRRLSCREVYGGYYRKHCTHILRYVGHEAQG